MKSAPARLDQSEAAVSGLSNAAVELNETAQRCLTLQQDDRTFGASGAADG